MVNIYPLASRFGFMKEWPYERRGSVELTAPTWELAKELAVRVIETIKRGEKPQAAVARLIDEQGQ